MTGLMYVNPTRDVLFFVWPSIQIDKLFSHPRSMAPVILTKEVSFSMHFNNHRIFLGIYSLFVGLCPFLLLYYMIGKTEAV